MSKGAGKGDKNTRIDPKKYREARYWRILEYKKKQEQREIDKSTKHDTHGHDRQPNTTDS